MIEIKRKRHKINADAPLVPETNYLKGRIGFWGIVLEPNSKNNTVTVVSDTGFQLQNIPVISNEWVTVDENKDYIPSTRNLPPKNSRVFVLTPTYTATGAFVLCSGFSRGDENIRTLWAKNDNEVQEKNNSRETKTQGGWDITENYENGNTSFVSDDEEVKITVNLVDDQHNASNKKKVELEAWGNKITVNNDGIIIKDKNNNEIKTTNSDIQINADTTKKIKIGNSVDTIKGILNDILQILNSSLATAGSPGNHTVVPGQFTSVITKLEQVLE